MTNRKLVRYIEAFDKQTEEQEESKFTIKKYENKNSLYERCNINANLKCFITN